MEGLEESLDPKNEWAKYYGRDYMVSSDLKTSVDEVNNKKPGRVEHYLRISGSVLSRWTGGILFMAHYLREPEMALGDFNSITI